MLVFIRQIGRFAGEILTWFEELDSGLTAFRGVGASSSLLTTSLCLSASGVEVFIVDSSATTGGGCEGIAAVDSSTLGGFVLARFLDGPIK
jgi:ribulose 1,5-bisphosphate synthetase/thiazole synthase